MATRPKKVCFIIYFQDQTRQRDGLKSCQKNSPARTKKQTPFPPESARVRQSPPESARVRQDNASAVPSSIEPDKSTTPYVKQTNNPFISPAPQRPSAHNRTLSGSPIPPAHASSGGSPPASRSFSLICRNTSDRSSTSSQTSLATYIGAFWAIANAMQSLGRPSSSMILR